MVSGKSQSPIPASNALDMLRYRMYGRKLKMIAKVESGLS
jgi:hypothetical protein